MEVAKKQAVLTQVRGYNFYGTMKLQAGYISLSVTEFKKGAIYMFETNRLDLQKQFRRFLILKKVEDLFDELSSNERVYISDQNTLILPISVQYKGKKFELSIEIPLTQRKFGNESQKMQYLFELIEKLNQQKIKVQKILAPLIPKLISFKGDESNQKFKSFEVNNKRQLKMLGTNQYITFNHCQPIEKKGLFCFKIKLIKSTDKYIMVGLCGGEIKSAVGAYHSPYYLGFNLSNGNLVGNNKNPCVAPGFKAVENESVIKVQIDMNKKLISWLHNQIYLYAGEIPKELCNINIHPMVNFYTNGDIVELLDK